jgi:hypothetical protein
MSNCNCVCLSEINDLQNPEEYYEFVKQLQNFNSFPETYEDRTGIYIVLKIKAGKRKMKLGLGILKEQNNYNISCYKVNLQDNLERAVEGDRRFNFLDHEIAIMGLVTLMREFFVTPESQGVNAFWITVFPLQLDIARKILNRPDWIPVTLYKGGILPRVVTTNNDVTSMNVKINIDETFGQGNGSGFGLTKRLETKIIEAIPVKKEGSNFSLQVPQKRYTKFEVTPLNINDYNCFQVQMIGNQRNVWPISNLGKKLLFDFDMYIICDEV